MKKFNLTLLITLIGVASIFAQAPQSFKYQAVVRDNTGNIITNQPVSIRTGIIQDSIFGAFVYSETHGITTNQFGMIVLEIGSGTIETGVFDSINWGTTSHFLKLELDETGGTNYQFMGISELLSVPYSINSASVTLTSPGGEDYEVTVDDNGNLAASCIPVPSIADAGPDQLNIVFPVTLAANNPVNGTGTWTIINGTGGNIADPNNPASEFTGIPGNMYALRWTITTRTNCYTEDDVYISTVNCPPIVIDIDGNPYNTVLIGTQCWMKENLKTTTCQNGIPIPNVTNDDDWINLTTGGYAWYDHDISWKGPYGALYNWHATVDANGLCPTGWHVPTNDEWTALTDFIGGLTYPHGNELKSCRHSPWGGGCGTTEHPRWTEYSTQYYGTDDYGFSGLPGGWRLYAGEFNNIGNRGLWWSSTESSSTDAWPRRLHYDDGLVWEYDTLKQYGISVRCLRD